MRNKPNPKLPLHQQIALGLKKARKPVVQGLCKKEKKY